MKAELQDLLARHGQEHLLAFWDELATAERQSLAEEIRAVDFPAIAALWERRDVADDVHALVDRAGEPPAIRLDRAGCPFTSEQAKARAAEAISAGRVGVILVAGGQGTRLGFPLPKGMFPIGPVSGKSLFQVHLEKVAALARRHAVRVPLYVMTSPATHDQTAAFLAEHGRFGLPAEDVRLFRQGTMPAVDARTGRLLLAAPGRLATSPDGHGGMLAALRASGSLADALRRGIRHLFYLQVDNPLVDICGGEFLGDHLLAGSEMSTQVVAKRDPMDRVGNVVAVDGRLHVIEYSDLPENLARRRHADGSLVVWAGSIAVHVFQTSFLERMAAAPESLPFHIARKRVPYVDADGRRVQSEEPNALKFERFIFDLLPAARGAIVVEVDPARAFAPLKNAPGEATDTPEWVQARWAAEHARWLRRAGAVVDEGVPVEISPLVALDPDELARRIPPGTRVSRPTYFG